MESEPGNKIGSFEEMSLSYMKRERRFMQLNIIVPILFIVGQSVEFILILSRRPIMPGEIRGFTIIIIMVIFILSNLVLYLQLQQKFIDFVTSNKSLSYFLYHVNSYRTRVIQIFFVLCILSLFYIIFFFAGFIMHFFRIRPPPGPPLIPDPTFELIVNSLITFSFVLQVIYLVSSWRHIQRWRISDRKLKEYEKQVFAELELQDTE